MYQFKEEINFRQFFWWKKKLIKNLNWALLPKSSKAVFPVIACHANQKGEAFPSEQTIAILAGVSDKIAREGIRGLEGFPGFKLNYYLSQRGKRAKKYMLKLPSSNNRGSAFPFFKFVLEAGIWREMIPSAKALYPVMRYFGYFDINFYQELEDDLEIEINDFDEIYSDREYDFCEAELSIMAEYAGLHRNSINAALNDLERNFLIEPLTGYNGWKVFLKSKDSAIWKRDYLNKKVMDSYKHILQCIKTTGNDAQKLPNDAQKGSER
jgi:hypothetical protein